MKANSKKLLSLLMAVAMVLSMAPAISLQAEAAFDPTSAVCEHCGGEAKTWTALTSADVETTLAAGHYYVAADLSAATTGATFTASAGTVCIQLNGKTVANTGTTNTDCVFRAASGAVLNVMGEGFVKNSCAAKTTRGGAVVAHGGTANLYGGTYSYEGSTTGITLFTATDGGTINMYEGASAVAGAGNRTGNIQVRSTNAYVNIFGGNYAFYNSRFGSGVAKANLQIYGGTFTFTSTALTFADHLPNTTCYSVTTASPYVVTASHTKADGDEGTVVVVGDCTTDREVKYTCSVEGCGAEFYEVTEAPGHDFGENNATCANCGAANPNYTGNLPATCPGCGEAVTEWIPVTGAPGDSNWTADMSGHYYLKNDIAATSKRVWNIPAGAEVCLHLNGKSITNTGSQSSAIALRVYGTVRLMGEGTVSTGSNTAALAPVAMYDGAIVEVYGGTYTAANGESTVRRVSGTVTANVYGGTFSDIAKTYVAEGYAATENEDGTWTVAALNLPTECPCGATNLTAADWTELTDNIGSAATEHTHYYLGSDLTLEGTGNSIQLYADHCLYLNGHTLTNNGTIRARGGFNLHIFGEGGITRPDSEGTGALFNSDSSGYIYIYGGTYTNNDPDVALFNDDHYVITGGTFNADPSAFVADGYMTVETDGVWVVQEGHECVWDEGVQTQAPTCTAEGVMTYTCTVDGCDKTRTEPIEKVPHDFGTNNPTCLNCTEPNPDYVELPTTCPGCGEEVTNWIPVTGAPGDDGWTADMSGHYYLANDITASGKRVWSIPAGAEVCLHLSGKNITSTSASSGAITLRVYGTLRLMGEGTVSTGENTAAMAPVAAYGTANVEIYGGTYVANNGEPVVRIPSGTPTIKIYGGTFPTELKSYIADGYVATENEDGTFTVAKLNLPATCPMCGEAVAEWTEVTAATADSGWTADMSGHYYLANDIEGTAKRVFSFPAGTEVCLYLNGHDITGTVANNNAPIALRAYGTLRIGGEGTVSTPNVVPNAAGVVSWAVVAAGVDTAGNAGTVEIYGGTYIDGADRNRTVSAAEGATLTVYGGSFSNEVTGYVAENKWCLPKADMWHVEDLAAAAIITESGYTTYETTEAAVDAYTEGYILLGSANSIELTKAAVVDSNDKENVVVTGEGTLSPVGGGSWDLTNANVNRDATNPVTGVRYLTVENNTYKFDMKISKVVLRPGTTSKDLGIYYKTKITIGNDLVNLIDSYGVALSLLEMPTAQDILAVGSHALYTVVDNDLVAGENTVTSGLLSNILKTESEYTAEELETMGAATVKDANNIRGELKIYANAYVAIDLDGDGTEEIIMADVEDNDINHTLKGIMGKVNAMESIPQAAINCYKAWAPVGMDQWGLTNLAAKAAE